MTLASHEHNVASVAVFLFLVLWRCTKCAFKFSLIICEILCGLCSDPVHNLSGIHPSELNALESVQEITDFLQIQANFTGFHNLSFFRNLKVIHGRALDR